MLSFTVLGPSGSGKTTILASMYNELENSRPGTFYPTEGNIAEFDRLNNAYEDLQAMANSTGQNFDVRIKPDNSMREYSFTIFGQRNKSVKFYDYPGGWLDRNHQEHSQVIDVLRDASVIFVTINSPYLMENNGKYAQRAKLNEIQECLIECLAKNRQDKLIVFVPIKCEKYTQPSGDVRELRDKIKYAFNGVLSTGKTFCAGRLAVALLPVQTIGNRKFGAFKTDDNGNLIAEGYEKIGDKFNPRNADQPMRYALSFLLKQFDNNNGVLKRFWENLFPSNRELKKEMDNFIRGGMALPEHNSEFEILYGRDLIPGKEG